MSDYTTSGGEMKHMPRGRGRPRSLEPGASLTTWVPNTTHDRLIALANQRGESVSSLIRNLLVLRLR